MAGAAAWDALFRPTFAGVPHELSDALVGKSLGFVSQLGLILLLFLVGLEFDFGHLRQRAGAAIGISIAGIALPFALGFGLAALMHSSLEPHPETSAAVPQAGFALFLGVALAITAIPVLARIMMELNITRTRIGTITITAAAIEDTLGWIILATVSAVVRTGFEPWATLRMVAETLAFALGMIFLVRPMMKRWIRWTMPPHGDFGIGSLAILLAIIFGCAVLSGLIGIFAVFGAFMLEAVLSDEHEFGIAVSAKLRDVVTGFLLPIFFTSTGLRTNIGSLGSWPMVMWAAIIFIAAVIGKLAGCGLWARWSGFSVRESACIGAMMNTRGLMELVVVNLGFELHVIPPSVYC